ARLDTQAEPQDKHRHEGGGGRRHQAVDVQVKKMLDITETPHKHAQQNAHDQGQEETGRQSTEAHNEIIQKLATGEQPEPSAADFGQWRYEDTIQGPSGNLPEDGEDENRNEVGSEADIRSE